MKLRSCLLLVTGTFALVTMLAAISGCSIVLEDEGSVKFTFGTTIGIESSSSTTHSKSNATFAPQSLDEWFGPPEEELVDESPDEG